MAISSVTVLLCARKLPFLTLPTPVLILQLKELHE